MHAVQERIAKAHGSQCGFCTPGIVMSMYTLLRNNPKPEMEDIETYFQVGNAVHISTHGRMISIRNGMCPVLANQIIREISISHLVSDMTSSQSFKI